MLSQFRRAVDAAERDIRRGELFHQRTDIERAEGRRNQSIGFSAVLDPRDVRRKLRIAGKRGIAENLLRQNPPFAVALD